MPRATRNLLYKVIGGTGAYLTAGPVSTVPYAVSGLSQLEGPAKAMLGGFDKQKQLRKLLNEYNPNGKWTAPSAGILYEGRENEP
jgi:hypothetical protein